MTKFSKQAESWATRNWRPTAMFVFLFLIIARWFGFASSNISEAEHLALWDIIKYCMTSYAIGRSLENITPAVASAIASKNASVDTFSTSVSTQTSSTPVNSVSSVNSATTQTP